MEASMSGNFQTLVRPQKLAASVVFVDGMTHSGKQLVAQLFSTIDRGELCIFNQEAENLCIAHAFGKVTCDAASAIISLAADTDLYNLMISRYINFRSTDETGVQFNLSSKRYKKRLYEPDGDIVVARIAKERPILSYMTHHMFGISSPMFNAFHERLKLFVVCVRHPLWIIDLWCKKKWRSRIARDPREFQMCCTDGRANVPWFAGKWIPDYLRLKPVEQAIRILDCFHKSYRERLSKMSTCDRKKVYFLPFETFVSHPWPFIQKFAHIFRSNPTELSRKMAKKFYFPRPRLCESETRDLHAKIGRLMKKEGTPVAARNTLEHMCCNYSQYLKTQDERATILR